MLEQLQHIHFIGIGGIGMSGLARILLTRGKTISGSDARLNPLIQQLQEQGALIHIGHAAEQITPDVDCIVVSTAISKENPELKAAKKRNLPVFHRSEILNYLLTAQHSVAITGTHGKTTSTAMQSLVLKSQELDPSAIIGGIVPQLGGNALTGKGPYIVAEVDESDQSLRKLDADTVLITNIEADHLEHYQGLDEIFEAIQEFVGRQSGNGNTIVNLDDPGIQEFVLSLPEKKDFVTFGIHSENTDYQARHVQLKADSSSFTVFQRDKNLGDFELSIPGLHNVYNALGTIVVAHQLKPALNIPALQKCLSNYHGVNRRLQLVGQIDGVSVIDDYSHHPSEVEALLKTVAMQKRPVTAIFQPHRFSRTQALLKEFSECFTLADRIILTDVYAASEKPEDFPVSIEKLQDLTRINNPNKEVKHFSDFDDIIEYLGTSLAPNELVLTIGAGNITTLSYKLVDYLENLKLEEEKTVYA